MSGYLVLFVSSHTLSTADNANFLAFWGVILGLFGALTGLMAEATRAVKSRAMNAYHSHERGAPVLAMSIIMGLVIALLVTSSSPWWMPTLIPYAHPFLWIAIGLAVLLYAGHVGLAGATSGAEEWTTYSVLSGTEAIIRLATTALAALVFGSLAGIEFAVLSGTLVWLFFAVFSRAGRVAVGARADVGVRRYLIQCSLAIATAAASAVLITGFPAVIKFVAEPSDFAKAAPLLLAISLTRAPIMIPLQAFQGVVMTALINSSRPAYQVLAKPLAVIMLLGVIGSAAAALVGPSLMLIFGADYSVSGWILGALTLDAALLAVLTLTGTSAMALGRHKLYLAGWIIATVAAATMLLLPLPLEATVILSLSVGPIVGALIHAVGIATTGKPSIPVLSTTETTEAL
ncbi:hypothetical protein AAGW05_00655 [Arthrobacter sp. LAPM80]|uniref:hypothetical protein n=1 Tax=Arthrobacter sp. LAPM80 TaxID=3141788 RepID=UPI00398ACB26